MVAKNLKHTFIVALEKNGKQTNLTIFPNVLDDLSIDKTIIEDELWMFVSDFKFQKKKHGDLI